MLYAILASMGGIEEVLKSVWAWTPTVFFYVLMMLLGLATFALFGVFLFQRDMVYPAGFPANSRTRVSLPSQFGMPHFDDLRLETSDKVVIRGYLIKRETDEETKRAPTVLFLHANAGNMGHRLPIAKIMYDKLKCSIFMLSYRGYGLSEGQPYEAGIKTDALTALQFLRSHPLTANTKIVAYGQSLGGAVAIDIVSSNQDEFVGLMLENTFLSIPKMIPSVMPLLRYLTFLSWEKWDSEQAIRKIAGMPVLFLSGLRDDLVPPPHMRKLFELASRGEKNSVAWEEFDNGTHNDTCTQEGYFEKMAAWWEAQVVAADPYVPTGRLGGMGTKDIVERSNGTREIIDKDEQPAEPVDEKSDEAKKDD